MRHPLDPRPVRAALALGGLAAAAAGSAVAAQAAVPPSVPAATAASPALATSPVPASAAPRITVNVADSTLHWGQWVTVTGQAKGASGVVALQFRGPSGAWTALSTAHTDHLRYRFHAKLPGRGAVRVVNGTGQAAAVAASSDVQQQPPPALIASKVRGVKVSTALSLKTQRTDVSAGRSAVVAGRALPGKAGRVVVLQRRRGHRWVAVDHDRTTAHGAYRLTWRTSTGGAVRVVARGDAVTASAARSAGRVSVLRSALASWYGDYGGPLACGGTLGYDQQGVANKELPCGTRVTIRYHGNTVRVPVIDRGPYVGGREFDLTGATARSLGFDGVGTVQVSTR